MNTDVGFANSQSGRSEFDSGQRVSHARKSAASLYTNSTFGVAKASPVFSGTNRVSMLDVIVRNSIGAFRLSPSLKNEKKTCTLCYLKIICLTGFTMNAKQIVIGSTTSSREKISFEIEL